MRAHSGRSVRILLVYLMSAVDGLGGDLGYEYASEA